MPRKTRDLGDTVNARIVALMAAGRTSESITEQLRKEGVKNISRATVGRRMKELRPKVPKARAAAHAKKLAEAKPLPASPEDIPEDADASEIDEWLKKAKHMADVAYSNENLDDFGKMGRLTSALLEAKRKATPPKPPDPNDQPDMLVAKERARGEFHKLISKVLPS